MDFLRDQAGRKIVYDKITGQGQTIVFLTGLKSDRTGSKANFLRNFAKNNNINAVFFDYLGHGDSDLNFNECGIEEWLENSLQIIDELTSGPVTLIGSSLGGWLAYLIAQQRKERIHSILALAPAPDFTETLMWDIFSEEVKQKIIQGESYFLGNDYCDDSYEITKKLIDSGRKFLLLKNKEKIELSQSLTIIHGMDDHDVDYNTSIETLKKVSSVDKKLVLLGNSGHRLSSMSELARIELELRAILRI